MQNQCVYRHWRLTLLNGWINSKCQKNIAQCESSLTDRAKPKTPSDLLCQCFSVFDCVLHFKHCINIFSRSVFSRFAPLSHSTLIWKVFPFDSSLSWLLSWLTCVGLHVIWQLDVLDCNQTNSCMKLIFARVSFACVFLHVWWYDKHSGLVNPFEGGLLRFWPKGRSR